MTKLPPELLDRQPEEVSRVLALSLLDEAAAALERMADPSDTEALHDFRVALRRLRSVIRAYRPYLKDSVPKKARKALRSLTASTNAARDTEVQLAWIRAQEERLNDTERGGLRWLAERLEANGDNDREEGLRDLTRDFNRVRKILIRKLSFWKVTLDAAERDKHPSFRKTTGNILLEQLSTLLAQLDAIHSPEDNQEAHSARISAKRLRYLLEPLSRAVPGTKPLVKRFKRLQDLLGDLHDTNLMVVEIGEAMEASAIERARRLHERTFQPVDSSEPQSDLPVVTKGPDENPGLLALAKLLKERRQDLFTGFTTEWRGDRLEKFRVKLEELGATLTAMKDDERVVRRFVLRRPPELLKNQTATWIQEGWIPGATVDESLRRVRVGKAVRYFRTVIKDDVTTGTAHEEPISRRVFESLWPLTEKKRIRKRRYEVVDGPRTWGIDVFIGLDLVLAEIAVPRDESAGTEIELPDWLAPLQLKEVTGDKKYLRPYRIAKRTVPRRRRRPVTTSAGPKTQPEAQILEEKLPSNGRDRNLLPETSTGASVEES